MKKSLILIYEAEGQGVRVVAELNYSGAIIGSCSNKTLFRLTTETYQDSEWSILEIPYSAAVKAYLTGKYGSTLSEVLNEILR